MGMNDPDRTSLIRNSANHRAVYRKALLGEEGGRRFWLVEYEIPNQVATKDGVVERVNRLMHFQSAPVESA